MITEEIRSYEVSIWTLQDEFITVLKWSNAENKGTIENPKMVLNIDGTQTFDFSIPMYYRINGQLVENPNWYNTCNGNIIASMRKIKVIFNKGEMVTTTKTIPVNNSQDYVSFNVYDYIPQNYNGNVDLSNRKIIPASAFLIKGYNFSGSYGTLYSTTLSDSNGNAYLFTPIKSDGTVLSLNELNAYFSSLTGNIKNADAAKDKLLLGVFTVQDYGNSDTAITMADTYGDQLHSIQAEWDYIRYVHNWYGDTTIDPNHIYNDSFSPSAEFSRRVQNTIDAGGQQPTITTTITEPIKNNVFEFIITDVQESHEKDVATCDVKCEGLAFHELGKVGYKISLSQENFEIKYKKWAESDRTEPEPLQTIDYWCGDKTTCNIPIRPLDESTIDPNTWYYKVCMDQKSFKDGTTIRSSAKVYEEPYPIAWNTTTLIPIAYKEYQEKARAVSADKSNLYNLTQSIAEAFQIHCRYEYTYDENYHITSRTIVFYNHFFKEEAGAMSFTYPYSSSKITRDSDCTNLTTKLYVLTEDNDKTVAGYNSIMNASTNSTHEDYILNFNYMLDCGIISQDQYDAIKPYEIAMREYNERLIALQQNLATYNIQKPEIEAKMITYQRSIAIDEENIAQNQALKNALDMKDADPQDGLITINENNPDMRIVQQDKNGVYYINLMTTNKGIKTDTVRIYRHYNGASHNFPEKIPNTDPEEDNEITSGFTFSYDEYGRPSKILGITPRENSNSVYLTYKYDPQLYYDAVVKVWNTKLGNDSNEYSNCLIKLGPKTMDDIDFDVSRVYTYYAANDKLNLTHKIYSEATENEKSAVFSEAYNCGLNKQINETTQAINNLLDEKADEMKEFNRLMGAALREGYWQPEDYKDYGINKEDTDQLQIQNMLVDTEESFIAGWDEELFDEENKNYYEEGVLLDKIYYPCIDLSSIYNSIKNNIMDYSFIFNNNYLKDIENNNDIRYTQIFSIGSGALLEFGKKNNQIYPLLVLVGAKSMSDGSNGSFDEIAFMKGDGHPRLGIVETHENGTYTISTTIDVSSLFVDGYEYKTVQPRIKFSSLNLRADSSDFVIKYNDHLLEIAKDYIIQTRNTLRNGQYYPEYFLTIHSDTIYKCGSFNGQFDIHYVISNADNEIYLDALEVSKENAYPKVEYSVAPNILNRELSKTLYSKLASLVMINDVQLKLENVFGYISKVELNLDNVTKDQVEVKNYTSKFEDLFSTIVAQTEQMKQDNAKFHAASDGAVALTESAVEKTLTQNELVWQAYLDSYFDSSEVVRDRLASLFTEAGEILGNSNKTLNQMRALTLDNASILSGFAENIAKELTPQVYRSSTKPDNFKVGDIWIDDEGNRYIATSSSDSAVGGGTSGFVRTHDGTLASITGASIDINADDGIINIEAENEINIKSGNNIYIAANEMVEIIGNNKVNIGGTEINLCSLAEKKLNPLTGQFEYILDDNNHQIIHTTTGINLIAGEYQASGNYGTTARVLIKPTKIEIGASELLLKAASKMNLITSQGATNNTSAVHISAEDGIWIGTGTSQGVRLFSGEVKLNSNGTVDTTVTSATGASVELNAEHLILGYANTQSNSATAIEMNDTFVIIAAGDQITGNKTTDNNKIITGTTGSLIGAKFTKESIGFAVGSGANISAILMNGTNGITIGSGSIDVTASSSDLRAVQDGSYVRIGGGGIELGSLADLYINTDNFKLQTHSRDKGNTGYIDGNTLLALGKGLQEIGYTTSLADIRTKNTRQNNPTQARLVINDNGAYFEGDVYANNGYFNGEVNATSFVGIGANGKFIADPTRFGLYQSNGSTVILAADVNGNLTAGGDLTISSGKTLTLSGASLNIDVTSSGTIGISSTNFSVNSNPGSDDNYFYVGTSAQTAEANQRYIKFTQTGTLEIKGSIIATSFLLSGATISYNDLSDKPTIPDPDDFTVDGLSYDGNWNDTGEAFVTLTSSTSLLIGASQGIVVPSANSAAGLTTPYLKIDEDGIELNGKHIKINGQQEWSRDDIVVMSSDPDHWSYTIAGAEAHMANAANDWVLIKPYYDAFISHTAGTFTAQGPSTAFGFSGHFSSQQSFATISNMTYTYTIECEVTTSDSFQNTSSNNEPSCFLYLNDSALPDLQTAQSNYKVQIALTPDRYFNTTPLSISDSQSSSTNLFTDGGTIYYFLQIAGAASNVQSCSITNLTISGSCPSTTERVPCTVYYYPKNS